MDDTSLPSTSRLADLPAGLNAYLKGAARELVLAAGGPKGFRAIVAVSEGQVSRWCGDAYPDLMPPHIVALAELHLGVPAHTRRMAELTLHALVPVAEREREAGAKNLAEQMVLLARTAGEAVATYAGAVADGKIDAREARDIAGTFAGLKSALGAIERLHCGLEAGQ